MIMLYIICSTTSKKELKHWLVAAIKRLMNLDDAQRSKVGEWIAQGMKLSDIQARMASELGLHLTYMDVRLLVDDLKLTPKDVEQPKTAAAVFPAKGPTAAAATASRPAGALQATGPAPGTGSVSVDVDQ